VPLLELISLRNPWARTLQEIGEELHVSRERIRQIEAQALRKLRSHSRGYQFQDYLQ
jgi:RNA polymerase primary sigma factor